MDKKSVFENLGEPVVGRKGDFLIRQGKKNSFVYILKAGLLKAHYTTPEGKEFIKSFILPGEFIGSLISCRTGEPSTFNLMCLEDSTLSRIQFSELQNAANNYPEVANFITNGLMELAIKKERREYEFLCISASERYSLLKKSQPKLVERLTQNDIARYLGITPVALSRIKQRENKHDS